MKTNLEWALNYASLGWAIFPVHFTRKSGACSCGRPDCNRVGKHPATKNGLKDASADAAVIKQWWAENDYYNIGYATGSEGRTVIDIDLYGKNKITGQAKRGPEELKKLETQYGTIPDTLRCKTGGGGTHIYFQTIHEIKNSQDLIAPDIDVRGVGGYVILPPSNHPSGGHYEWENWGTPLAELPQWTAARAMTRALAIEELQPEIVAEAKKKPEKLQPEQVIRLLDFIPSDCDRDVWWKVGAALKTELGSAGWMAWREWSLTYKPEDRGKGWNEATGEAQWKSFEGHKEITVGTLIKYAQDNGFRGFDKETANLPEIKDEWVYVIGIKRFVELQRMIELDKEQYDARFAPLFLKGKPSDHTLKNEDFLRLDGITYWPQKERILIEEGEHKLNTWRGSGVEAGAGDVKLFLEHVDYLFPIAEEANILMDYLAYQVQHPGEKIHWAILMQGDQGNGKSYFGEVMKIILGEHNVRAVTNEMLHEPFTGWIKSKQMIIVEEMMAGKRLELMNKLKPMITEKWISIREMYKPPYEQPNRVNFLFLTNHSDPIIIDKTDRRYCVLASAAPPHPNGNKYYARLFDWTRSNAGALLRFMLDRDLRAFAPKAHAPMTAGKKALIMESMPDIDQFIMERVMAVEHPFVHDLIVPSQLSEVLRDFNLARTPKEIGKAFARLGYERLGKIGDGEGSGVMLYAIRNASSYRSLSSAQLRSILSLQAQGAPKETPGVSAEDALKASRPANPLKGSKPI